MKKTTLIALGISCGLLAAPAFAQGLPDSPADNAAPHFGHEGPESGGLMTRDEFMARAAQHFDDIDTNHDGKISPEERQAARTRHGEHHGKHGGLEAPEAPPATQ